MTFIESTKEIINVGVVMTRGAWIGKSYQQYFGMAEGALVMETEHGFTWNFSLSISDILANDWITMQKTWTRENGWILNGKKLD